MRNAAAADRFRGAADRMAAAALRTYRTLVETPGFAEWFAKISPLEEISGLRIGSRRARRGIAWSGWTTCAPSRGCSPGRRPG